MALETENDHKAAIRTRINVVVVDPDPKHRNSICRHLSLVGAVVFSAGSGAELNAVMAGIRPDLVILNINLPDEDGCSVAARLRAAQSIGIIMLMSDNQLDDRVMALSAGADACIEMPVQIRQLEAQFHSLIRRLSYERLPAKHIPNRRWLFDATNWSLLTPGGARIALTNVEYRLLRALAAEPGVAATREKIATALGKSVNWAEDRNIDAIITRLRRKIGAATGEKLPLKAARGVGYVFTERIDQQN